VVVRGVTVLSLDAWVWDADFDDSTSCFALGVPTLSPPQPGRETPTDDGTCSAHVGHHHGSYRMPCHDYRKAFTRPGPTSE